MPTYMYRCGTKLCTYQFEILQPIIDDPLSECPLCKNNTLTKIIQKRGSGSNGFQLQGNGWFKDGY